MKRQAGLLLVELLAVLAVVAILSAIALPYFQDFRLRQELQSGEQTILQSLQKARHMARSQGVFVNVQFSEGELSLTSSNDPNSVQRFALPKKLVFANATNFMFTPNGTLGLPADGNGTQLGGLSFEIRPADQQSTVEGRTIQVGSFGSIAGL